MEAEHLEDVVADEAVFVVENPEGKWTLHIYQNGDMACYGRNGTTVPPALKMIVNRLPMIVGYAAKLGFDEAHAMIDNEAQVRERQFRAQVLEEVRAMRGIDQRLPKETITQYMARINREAEEQRGDNGRK